MQKSRNTEEKIAIYKWGQKYFLNRLKHKKEAIVNGVVWSNIQNLDGILDESLKIAARVIAIVAFPALIIVAYRNIFLVFVPYHQLFLTICYGLFVFLGFGKIKSNQIIQIYKNNTNKYIQIIQIYTNNTNNINKYK